MRDALLVITFARRGRLRRYDTHHIRSYASECGRYRVAQLVSLVGLGRRWLAIRRLPTGEFIISRHRKRGAAETACRRHAATLPPAVRPLFDL